MRLFALIATNSSAESRGTTKDVAPIGLTAERQVVVVHEAPKRQDVFDIIEKVIQLLAVVIGAIWVWANYLLNRTHRARLEARITAEVLQLEGGFVKIVLGLKNVGLSKVDILQEGTAARIYSFEARSSSKPYWKHRLSVPIWNSVTWVEPGESCEEQQLLPIPIALRSPIKFELFIVCQHRSFPLRRLKKQVLRASFVLPPPASFLEVRHE